MSEIKKGDRVRVTFEGEVTHVSLDGTVRINRPNEGTGFAWANPESVEKIEPPVETFKPGDVVRAKKIPGFRYALYGGGYVDLYNGIDNPGEAPFTTDNYEKVDGARLVEPPL